MKSSEMARTEKLRHHLGFGSMKLLNGKQGKSAVTAYQYLISSEYRTTYFNEVSIEAQLRKRPTKVITESRVEMAA